MTKRREPPPPTSENERTLPHNLEAERSVLGAILLHNDAYEKIGDALTAPDFYREAHRIIYESITRIMERRDGSVDLVTIKEDLDRAGELEEAGGPVYISALVDGVPRSTNVRHYAEIVHEKATLRRLIMSSNRILSKAYAAEESAETILADADRAIVHLQLGQMHGRMLTLEQTNQALMEHLEYLHQHKGELLGITTGFKSINDQTLGWQAGDMNVIAARPSIGKTAFILNAAVAAAENPRLDGSSSHVAIFSLEMRRKQLECRMLANLTGIPFTRIMSGYIYDQEWKTLGEAMGRLKAMPIHIDDGTSRSVWDIRTECRQIRAEHGLGLVIIDYVQLMPGDERARGATRNEQVTEISRRLKTMADELSVPVLLLSQLSRAASGRPDPTPKLSDLRESGALEQDADAVIFLHRRNHREGGLTRFIIEKQRNGPTGTLNLSLDRDIQRFSDWEGEEPPPEQATPEEKQERKVKAIIRRRAKG